MSDASLQLRPFTAADDRALIDWVRSADELLTFAGPNLTWPLDTAQLEVIRSRRDTIAWTAVIPSTEEAVGHIELVTVPGRPPHIARVIVDPARRRQGLGRLLLIAVLDEARGLGAGLVSLNVRRRNEAAIRLYTGLGFRDDEDVRDPDVARMTLRLDV